MQYRIKPKLCSCGTMNAGSPRSLRLHFDPGGGMSGLYWECWNCRSTLFERMSEEELARIVINEYEKLRKESEGKDL